MPASTLTETDSAEIVSAFEAGETRMALAATYRVHPNTITRVLRSADHPVRRAQRRSLTEAEVDDLVAAYIAGEKTAVIAERFGVTSQHVSRTAISRGASRRHPGKPGRLRVLSDDESETVARAYEGGASLLELAAYHHVATATIVSALKRHGVARRAPHRSGV